MMFIFNSSFLDSDIRKISLKEKKKKDFFPF